MFSITATGFVAEKPMLEYLSRDTRVVEFDVVSSRRGYVAGEWKTFWERATFVAWNDEAEKICAILDKHSNVFCTGLQETSEWVDKESGKKRYKTKYRLTAWTKEYQHQTQTGDSNHSRAAQRDERPREGFNRNQFDGRGEGGNAAPAERQHDGGYPSARNARHAPPMSKLDM